MLKAEDITFIESRGSSVASVKAQIERFKSGFPYLDIIAPAVPGKGIAVLSEEDADKAVEYYDKASVNGKCKFVPASGAASRMFKDLFGGLEKVSAGESLEGSPAAKFCQNIKNFAFYDSDVFASEDEKSILEATLKEGGLNYGAKPKGVLKFHKYASGEVRTAIAEHLVEAQEYMRNEDGTANLVITISPEHEKLFRDELAAILPEYEKKYGIKYNVKFTYQDKATDTVAVDPANEPFRKEDGSLLFRPAGHGALIFNLNDVDAELVSIKNIDNVSCERFLPVTARYKKVLMGKALELRDMVFGFEKALDEATGAYVQMFDPYPLIPGINNSASDLVYMSEEVQLLCNDIEEFLVNELSITLPPAETCKQRVENIRKKLNRPIRVCGMVRNQGEAGGGPFIIREKDGSTSLQILEGPQIKDKASLADATHFNPVDIVCCLKDYNGEKFNLPDYVDDETGFISSKSYQGRELKALELPGLWNGAMSDWNTIFVEVSLGTFNPVKTVNDLLREQHQ